MPSPIPLRRRLDPPQMFPIERGIPFPGNSRRRKYPFAEMAVGDSFFVPGARPGDMRSAVRGWVTYKPERSDRAFTVRKNLSGGVVGARVWRVA